MRYALIGCGRVAPNHITAMRASGLELVGLCDLDKEKMQAFIQAMGLPEDTPLYESYENLFETARPELVAVATWSGEHAKIALAAIRRGIHVIIEKPVALSMKDARELVEEARKHHVKLCVSHQNRFNPAIQKMRGALEEGKIGSLTYVAAHVRWFRGAEYYAQDERWRGTYAQDGGALMNQCIHNADLLRWMLGDDISEVFAYTANQMHPYIEAEDLGLAVIKAKNGSYGLFEGTVDVVPNGLEETLYLFGKKGTVKAGGIALNRMEAWEVEDENESLESIQKACDENPENVYGFGHTPLYRDMIEAIRQDRKPYVDGEAGLRALEIILAMYESARTHAPVSLPLGDISTMDFVSSKSC